MTDSAISLAAISKTYRDATQALENVNLNVERGEIIGFVGRNGAGKTTAIRIMIGAILPTSGTVEILGESLSPESTALKRKIGYVPAEDLLFRHLTGQEQILLSALAYGISAATTQIRAAELVEVLDLKSDCCKRIRDCSYGMKKKIALACALTHDPSILFLDEPLEGLDVVTGRTLKDTFQMMRERGKTLLLTSHNLSLIDDVCSRVAVLDCGRIIFDGSTEELKRYTGLLGSDNLEDAFIRIVGCPSAPAPLSWIVKDEGGK